MRGPVLDTSQKDDELRHFHKHLARLVTGKHQQDASMLISGSRGTGKSWSAQTLGYFISREIARIRDGDPEQWRRYFDLKTCMACINQDAILELMATAKPYQVLLYDDAGAGWDARDSQKNASKFLNHVLEVSRTRRNVILITVPSEFLIDKVPRSLTLYRASMDEPRFNWNPPVAVMRIYKSKITRDGKQWNYHIASGRLKFIRYLVHRPPPFLTDEYDVLREQAAQREYGRMKEEKALEERKAQDLMASRQARDKAYQQVRADVAGGMSISEACKKNGLTRNQYYQHPTV